MSQTKGDKSFLDMNFADSGRKKLNDYQLKIVTQKHKIFNNGSTDDVCRKNQFDRSLRIIKRGTSFTKVGRNFLVYYRMLLNSVCIEYIKRFSMFYSPCLLSEILIKTVPAFSK